MIRKLRVILFILIVAQSYILFKNIKNDIEIKNNEVKNITNFLNTKTSKPVKVKDSIDYKIVIEIPKIGLKKGILSKEHMDNNIDKNITILKESNYPNELGNIYIAAHSGSGKHSYFNDLTKLKKKDITYLYHENIKYTYEVIEIKSISKETNSSILTTNKNNLILITCNQKDKNKYLVIILKQIKKQNYT